MWTGQTNVRKEVLFQDDLSLGRESRKSTVEQHSKFSEKRSSLMLTRQTNVRKEVLFQDDFQVWVVKVGKVGGNKVGGQVTLLFY